MKKERWAGYFGSLCRLRLYPTRYRSYSAFFRGEKCLQNLALQEFAVRAAHFYGEIDAIQPFREGNSRTLRQFFSDLAIAAGYKIDWTSASSTEQDRNQILRARHLAVMRGDSSLLSEVILRNLRPLQPT